MIRREAGDSEVRRCRVCKKLTGAKIADDGFVMPNTACRGTDGCSGRTDIATGLEPIVEPVHEWRRATQTESIVWSNSDGMFAKWIEAGGLVLLPIKPQSETQTETEGDPDVQ